MVKNSIQQLLKNGIDMIEKRDFNNPFLDVQLILMELLGKDKLYLIMHPDEPVDQDIADKYYAMVKRRNEGYPLQYMLNRQEFMGLDFYVEEGVLVPRPDTETLVEKVINAVNENDELKSKEITILDIGTGSGAIALSLAYYLKNAYVTAIDISETALKVAELNRKKFNLTNARITRGNLFEKFIIENTEQNEADGEKSSQPKFDIIVSNPPYIEKKEIDELQTEVSTYEPRLALDGGESGLIYYERIAEIADKYLKPNGRIYLEIGNRQATSVSELMKATGLFKNVSVLKDLYANDRVIAAE